VSTEKDAYLSETLAHAAEVRRLQRLTDEQAHMLKIARAMLRDAGKGDLFELQCAASIKGGG
jgi:hypothetical protein